MSPARATDGEWGHERCDRLAPCFNAFVDGIELAGILSFGTPSSRNIGIAGRRLETTMSSGINGEDGLSDAVEKAAVNRSG